MATAHRAVLTRRTASSPPVLPAMAAAVAALVPAPRATRVDPMQAIRRE